MLLALAILGLVFVIGMASAYPQVIQTTTLTIDSVSWTAIAAPMDCNFVYILVGGANLVTFRTDSADANTGKTVSAGLEYSPNAGGQTVAAGSRPRFLKNQTFLFAQAAAGTGPLTITWEL